MTAFSSALAAAPLGPIDNPPELGRVHWQHDLDAGLSACKQSGKPIFLLFQEIPGCQGCKDFGADPLSHPLLVEALEDQFIPLAFRNNGSGVDEVVRKRFDEPASNYPVARLLDGDGKDLIPRQEFIFTTNGIATRMIEALSAAKRDVPAYLRLAADEADANRNHRELATFAMGCFWEGQAKLGGIDGVVSTRAGMLDGQEVVDVIFNPKILSYKQLIKIAQQSQCTNAIYGHSDTQMVAARSLLAERAKPAKSNMKEAPASDQNYFLQKSELCYLPLTPVQAMKLNSALGLQKDVERWLSPRQIALLPQIKAALARNPKSLEGLTRPDSVAELPQYEDQLRARLH